MDSFTLGYRKSLDGLRGIAVLIVVLSHMPSLPFSGGFVGVDLFFVLSGFLITSLLLEEWRETGGVRLKAFYIRRALRLLPALAEVLLIAVVVSGAVETPEESAKMRTSALITLLYSSNWFVAYRNFPRGELSATWSLSVEEQFYLLWPVLLLCLLRVKWSKLSIAALVGAGIVASACAKAVLWSTTRSWERVYFGSDTHADGLLAGAFVALLLASGVQPKSSLSLRVLNWVAHLMMTYLGMFVILGWAADPYLSQGGYLAINLGISAIVLCLVCAPWAPLRLLCEARPLVWLGRISYGVYLWHMVWFWLLRRYEIRMPGPVWGLPLVTLIAVAAASYYLLERPLLRLKGRYSRVSAVSP